MNEYDELCEYADLEGTELGEYCQVLLHLRNFNTDHGMGEKLDEHLALEITRLLLWFKSSCEIKTVKTTRTFENKELIFKD